MFERAEFEADKRARAKAQAEDDDLRRLALDVVAAGIRRLLGRS